MLLEAEAKADNSSVHSDPVLARSPREQYDRVWSISVNPDQTHDTHEANEAAERRSQCVTSKAAWDMLLAQCSPAEQLLGMSLHHHHYSHDEVVPAFRLSKTCTMP